MQTVPAATGRAAQHAASTRSSSSSSAYFYTAITFNPDEVAENMKKYGGFIPGIRPGKPTAEYLDFVLSRITAAGSLYLAIVALIPTLAVRLAQSQPEPAVRRLVPHHRRRRWARHRQAHSGATGAAPLRRVPQVMRVVLLGPPGAGKGTQAARLAERWGDPADLDRRHLPRERLRRHGARAARRRSYMDAGALVPDEITNAMVRDRLGARRRGRRASFSTASLATPSRRSNSTSCSPGSRSRSTR